MIPNVPCHEQNMPAKWTPTESKIKHAHHPRAVKHHPILPFKTRYTIRGTREIGATHRDEQLNREEWAVAMHLVVCVTARKLPLPARLPKCLRPEPSNQQPPLKEPQPRKEPAAEPGADKGKTPIEWQETNTKEKAKDKPNSPPVDLKRATKEFKTGAMEVEEFLPVLQVRWAWHVFHVAGRGRQ